MGQLLRAALRAAALSESNAIDEFYSRADVPPIPR